MIVLESDITEDTEIKAKRPGGGGGVDRVWHPDPV